MSLRYAYNTNGAASHRLDDAVRLIADSGYDGVALTLDHHHLDPFADGWRAEAERVAALLASLQLGSVVETGARFCMTIQIDSDRYVLRQDGEGLQVGRRNGENVVWLDRVDLELLPDSARETLQRGESSDAALVLALRGIVQAEVERGG